MSNAAVSSGNTSDDVSQPIVESPRRITYQAHSGSWRWHEDLSFNGAMVIADDVVPIALCPVVADETYKDNHDKSMQRAEMIAAALNAYEDNRASEGVGNDLKDIFEFLNLTIPALSQAVNHARTVLGYVKRAADRHGITLSDE